MCGIQTAVPKGQRYQSYLLTKQYFSSIPSASHFIFHCFFLQTFDSFGVGTLDRWINGLLDEWIIGVLVRFVLRQSLNAFTKNIFWEYSPFNTPFIQPSNLSRRSQAKRRRRRIIHLSNTLKSFYGVGWKS